MTRRTPDVVVAAAVRTPIGKFLGSFRKTSAVELGIGALEGLVERTGLDPASVDEVILGHARQAGCGPNPARQVAMGAGLPETIPAWTLNQACASGLQSIARGARAIRRGAAETVVAGGMESMTRVPHMLPDLRTGYRLGHRKLVDGMYRDGFTDPICGQVMGETAETLAREYGISREEQDRFARESQHRCQAAREEGLFAAEIVPVEGLDEDGNSRTVEADEHPRDDVTLEALAGLPTVFADEEGEGTVTPGNASGITDGAAALLLTTPEGAEARGLEPLARVGEAVTVGVDPARMGIGPVPAVRGLGERTGRTIDDWDLIELNEAFAAQVLACDRELDLPADRLNVHGGAIALGHPIGCTGARIVVTLLHAMRRREATDGLATLCVSGGLGMALELVREG